jgi:hypothetical protein
VSVREQGLRALAAVAAVALVLGGLVAGGRLLREQLRPLDRFTIPFADIECAAPPGLSRADFLGEVQYISRLPDRVELLDDGLSAHLTAAFTRHPWVERVEGVQVGPGQVRVRLTLRVPVLAVPVSGGVRCADAGGVLLPTLPAPAADELPRLAGRVPPPTEAAGQKWKDAAVRAAAATAGLLHPHRERLRLRAVEVSAGGQVRLELRDGRRVVWGRPPGQELPDEPEAAVKVERLLATTTTAADGGVIDLSKAGR